MSTPSSPPPPSIRHAADAVSIQSFADVIACLRAPDGCPWDLAQTHQTLRKYALEETYELADAIDASDDAAMREELGDVLLQVVLHAQLAAERGAFTLQDVVDGIRDKMVRRHPHVFGDADASDPAAVAEQWAATKKAEGRRLLEGVPHSMPPLDQARSVSDRAGRVGFDFPDVVAAMDKLREEVGELAEALESGGVGSAAVADELGDVLFAAVNVGRKASVDASDAVRSTIAKFRRRFGFVELRLLDAGRGFEDATLDEMEGLWGAAKREETAAQAE